MKTHAIKLPHIEILLVELPKGATDVLAFANNHITWILNNRMDGFKIPDGTWQPVSFLSSLSEEQAAGMVSNVSQPIGWRLDGREDLMDKVTLYVNYEYDTPQPCSFACSTALESLRSLLTREKIDLSLNWYLLIKK